MNRFTDTFAKLRAENKKALATFFTAGNPDAETTRQLVLNALDSGADIIELGLPFSDPSADDSAIQTASQNALANGMTLDGTLLLAREIRAKNTTAPIVLFSYFNPLLQYGLERLAAAAKNIGIDAFLVIDLPHEESEEFAQFLRPHDIALIPLISPATSCRRAEKILKNAQGFVCYLSVKNVTTSETAQKDYAEIVEHVAGLRKITPLPILASFNISTRQDAAQIGQVADGIIVGSAFAQLIAKHKDTDLLNTCNTLVREFKNSLG